MFTSKLRPIKIIGEPILYALGGHDSWAFLNSVERFLVLILSNNPDFKVINKFICSFFEWVRYDLQSESWSHAPAMNHARSLFGVANLENNLFVVGGRDHSSSLNSSILCFFFLNLLILSKMFLYLKAECFNPLTNKWTMCANMIKRRCSVGVTAINGTIFAIGGHEAISSTRYECGERLEY